ncbi:unnamed protein product [Dicrocoelium dendriticum]|nr:unnamed protein product [Dicrocoelium dendriticum]
MAPVLLDESDELQALQGKPGVFKVIQFNASEQPSTSEQASDITSLRRSKRKWPLELWVIKVSGAESTAGNMRISQLKTTTSATSRVGLFSEPHASECSQRVSKDLCGIFERKGDPAEGEGLVN